MELKEIIELEFKRFGFKQEEFVHVDDKLKRSNKEVRWVHEGEKFKSSITIYRMYNAIIFEQKQLINDEWISEPFGMMAPLTEVVYNATIAYGISLTTREYNEDWKTSNIIPGTEGK